MRDQVAHGAQRRLFEAWIDLLTAAHGDHRERLSQVHAETLGPLGGGLVGRVRAAQQRLDELALQAIARFRHGALAVELDGARGGGTRDGEARQLIQLRVAPDHRDVAADAVPAGDRARQHQLAGGPQVELAHRRVGREHRDGVAPAAQRTASLGHRRQQRFHAAARAVRHRALLIEPQRVERRDAGDAIHDGRRARTAERHLHQRRLQLLCALVEQRALIEDEAYARVMRIGDVLRIRQTQQRHHEPVGDVDALCRDITEDGEGDAALLGEARHHLREVEAFVDQLDAAHRDECDLSTLDRVECRGPRAQRARPLHAALESAAAGKQLGALWQDAAPHVLHGDGRSAHAAA